MVLCHQGRTAMQFIRGKIPQVSFVITCELGLSDLLCVSVKGGAWLCPNVERDEGGRTGP